ncbi:reverse transcriptase domain-containing protein [Tanacetum coccineum]
MGNVIEHQHVNSVVNGHGLVLSSCPVGVVLLVKDCRMINLIMEYLVNISKRRAFWSLNEDILKITILKTNTPYPSRKIRHIRACTHQRPQRNEAQYAVLLCWNLMAFEAEVMGVCLMVMVSVVGYWWFLRSDLCGLWLKLIFFPLIDVDLHGEATGRLCSYVGCINVPLDLCGSLAGHETRRFYMDTEHKRKNAKEEKLGLEKEHETKNRGSTDPMDADDYNNWPEDTLVRVYKDVDDDWRRRFAITKTTVEVVKARLNLEEVSRHSESGTPSRRRDLRKGLGSRRIRSVSGSPEPRHGRSESPRKKDPKRKLVFKRLEKGVFHRLGDKGKRRKHCQKAKVCKETDPFTPRIRYFDLSNRTRMPSYVKTYDRSEDPEDHLKIFQTAAKVERCAMPTWCHMFNSTLTRSARVWFDDLPPESVDSYDDLKEVFLANFRQQKKCTKDPVEIHHIKQREGESTEDFVRRFKIESMDVKGASEIMRISGFMHGITNPKLIKRLHDKIPKSVDKMMKITTSFLRGEVAADNQERKKQIEELLKAGKLSHVIKELKQNGGKDQPKTNKKGEASNKDKALAILMIQP